MSPAFGEVWEHAAKLSDEERSALAGLLIESLESGADSDAEAAWAVEIEKRVADLDGGAVKTIPWEQVRQRLLDRLNAD